MALYTDAEAKAGFAALKMLIKAQVPWYEQAALSDQVISNVVATVLAAAAHARAAPTSAVLE